MSEWKEYKLTELGSLARGKSKHRPRYAEHLYAGAYPFIQTGDIKAAEKYITSYVQTYSEAGLQQSKLWPEGTLCITIAANIADIAILKFPACFPDSVLGFIPDKSKNDLNFIFYTLKRFQSEIQKLAIGSVQDNINLGTFENIKFKIPLLSEQQSIAAILSSLDNKIDLLRRQNQTLEQLAQTIFKQWFVHYQYPGATGEMISTELGDVPKEWKVGRLGDELDILMGQSPDGESYNEKKEGAIFFQGRTDFGFRFPSTRLYTSQPKRMAESFDTLVSVRAPVGDINMAYEKCCIGRGLAAVKSKYKSYAFYKMQSYKPKFSVFETEGTVFGSLGKDGFNDLDSIIPTDEIKSKFEEVVHPMDKQIYNLSQEIQTLTQLRDSLLPRLMSGRLRVG